MHCWSSLSLHLTSCFLFFPLFFISFFFFNLERTVFVATICLSEKKINTKKKPHILLKVSQKDKKKIGKKIIHKHYNGKKDWVKHEPRSEFCLLNNFAIVIKYPSPWDIRQTNFTFHRRLGRLGKKDEKHLFLFDSFGYLRNISIVYFILFFFLRIKFPHLPGY